MKHSILFSALTYALAAPLFAEEAKAKPISLFNGKDLTGWHVDVPKADKNPEIEPSFTVRGGLLVSLGRPGGHLITDAIYQDYRLKLEYRFVSRACPNSWIQAFPTDLAC